MTFGKRIKELRIKYGLTQKELGRKIGVSISNISKYESNDVVPSLYTALKMANIFNVPLDYLLCDSNDPNLDTPDNTELEPKDDFVSMINSVISKTINKYQDTYFKNKTDEEALKIIIKALESYFNSEPPKYREELNTYRDFLKYKEQQKNNKH